MATSYQAINNRTDLEAALNQLFEDEQRAWSKAYFDGDSLPRNPSQQQQAFYDGMDALLRGLFDSGQQDRLMVRLKLATPDPSSGLSVLTYPYFIGDGRLDVSELREALTMYGVSELNLPAELGEDLYPRFEALATGVINGIADKQTGQDAYSVEELQAVLGDGLVKRLYLKGNQSASTFFEAVRTMNVSCGEFASADMGDALSYDVLQPFPRNAAKQGNARE